MKVTFVNKQTKAVRNIHRQGTCVTLSERMDDGTWEVISENGHQTELTAQSFLNYLMHWHMDTGYERVV